MILELNFIKSTVQTFIEMKSSSTSGGYSVADTE